MDEIELEHLAPLDADTIPDANQSHFCFSCETPINGLYCVKCGQKNDNYRRSIFGLFIEVASSLTAIENRIWRTWAMLIAKPGKVAREFADGRRTLWSSPVRVYIAMSIILFGFLNITDTQIISFNLDVEPRAGIDKPETELTADELKVAFSVDFMATQKQINARNAGRNFYLIEKMMLDRQILNPKNQDIVVNEFGKVFRDKTSTEPENGSEQIAPPEENPLETDTSPHDTKHDISINDIVDDITEATNDNALNINFDPSGLKLNDGTVIGASQISQFVIKILRNPSQINQPLKVWLPRIMFIMMPFSMFIGAIFIRGRENALLYDHLVHTAYIHAIAFLLILIALITSRIISSNATFNLIIVAMIIYLPLSLKRMFQRGWVKTIWTSYSVGFIYLLTILLLMTGITVSGLIIELSKQ